MSDPALRAIHDLRSAVYAAYEAAVSEEEIREQVEDALADCQPAAPHVGGGPKRSVERGSTDR